jgi:tRNA (uracil-5-)-methyltransferase
VLISLRRTPQLERIVYVSCNPKSCLVDVEKLSQKASNKWRGEPFECVRATPVDMFPHTDHCELVLLLERYVVRALL